MTPRKLVRLVEIAELLGVSKQRADQLRGRADFPAPVDSWTPRVRRDATVIPAGSPHLLIGPFDRDPERSTKLPYACVWCRRRFRVSTAPFSGYAPEGNPVRVLTLGRYVGEQYVSHPEYKADDPSGVPCGPWTVGLLVRPQVEVRAVRHIGKEGNLADEQATGTADLADPDHFEPVHDYGARTCSPRCTSRRSPNWGFPRWPRRRVYRPPRSAAWWPAGPRAIGRGPPSSGPTRT